MRNADRRPVHRRNDVLETLLADLERDLAPVGREIQTRFCTPRHPAVFVVGCPRSGTTLTYQWLASLGAFTYPTNFVSRFPTAPWVAARVQRLITEPDCDWGGELTGGREPDPVPFRSRLGKTRGVLGPNEFWYWWRRFLPENETHFLTEAQTAAVDTARMRAELAAWEAVRDRPLLMKGLILNWNLDWLAAAVPGSVFVHVHRDPLLNMQSLLEAREDFFGDRGQWYSFRPPEYADLKDRPAAEQVAGQVRFTEAGVRRGLESVTADRRLCVSYEDLCAAPETVYRDLRALLAGRGCDLPDAYDGPESFPVSRTLRMDAATEADVRAAWCQPA